MSKLQPYSYGTQKKKKQTKKKHTTVTYIQKSVPMTACKNAWNTVVLPCLPFNTHSSISEQVAMETPLHSQGQKIPTYWGKKIRKSMKHRER